MKENLPANSLLLEFKTLETKLAAALQAKSRAQFQFSLNYRDQNMKLIKSKTQIDMLKFDVSRISGNLASIHSNNLQMRQLIQYKKNQQSNLALQEQHLKSLIQGVKKELEDVNGKSNVESQIQQIKAKQSKIRNQLEEALNKVQAEQKELRQKKNTYFRLVSQVQSAKGRLIWLKNSITDSASQRKEEILSRKIQQFSAKRSELIEKSKKTTEVIQRSYEVLAKVNESSKEICKTLYEKQAQIRKIQLLIVESQTNVFKLRSKQASILQHLSQISRDQKNLQAQLDCHHCFRNQLNQKNKQLTCQASRVRALLEPCSKAGDLN